MKVFSLDVCLYATAYALAESEEEALAKIRVQFSSAGGELPTGIADFEVNGDNYSPDMSEVSLSPCVTFDPIPDNAELSISVDFDLEDKGV
jgi:hypothetical protein